MNPLRRQPPLRIQRRLAPHPRRGNRLLIDRIRHITGSEDTLNAGGGPDKDP